MRFGRRAARARPVPPSTFPPSSPLPATSPSLSTGQSRPRRCSGLSAAADRTLIAAVSLFDDYVGEGIPDGTRSLAVAVTLQPRDATLTEDDLQALARRIEARVARDTGGALRSG